MDKNFSGSILSPFLELTIETVIVITLLSLSPLSQQTTAGEIHRVTGKTITIQPAGTVTWKEMLQREVLVPKVLQRPKRVTPFMPVPGKRRIVSPPENTPTPSTLTPMESISLQRESLSPQTFSLITSFQALPDNNTSIPPDTMGAVGPNHLMSMLNTQVRIQDKTGGVISTVSLDTFWTSGTGLSGNPFDPKVIFDSLSGRWIATCDADAWLITSQVFFAISATDDPTGTWTFYSFVADEAGNTWADYPGFGVNTTWIAITNNMFTAGGSWSGVKMWVIDKSTALVGGTLTVTVFPAGFDNGGGYTGHTLKPAVTFDTGESKLYIVDNSGWNAGGTFLLRLSEITGSGPSPVWSVTPGSHWAGTGFFPVTNNFDYTQIDASQLGTTTRVETNDPRMLNVVLRNGKIWCTHTGGLPVGSVNRTATFWYQLDPSAMPNPIVQSGVLDPGEDGHIFFPSITANVNDDVVIGFSRSDSSRYVEGAFTGRSATDPLGTMQPIIILKAGEDSYIKDFGSGRVRWGDYSATVVDPVDDTTFWTIQEYAATGVGPNPNDDRWGTWWGKISIEMVSLSVTPDTWDIGVIGEGETRNTGPFTITNEGNVSEDFAIRGSDGAGGWQIGESVGLDTFIVQIDIDEDPGYDSTLTKTDQTIFTDVEVGESKNFNAKYYAPTDDSKGGGVDQSFTITITATRHTP